MVYIIEWEHTTILKLFLLCDPADSEEKQVSQTSRGKGQDYSGSGLSGDSKVSHHHHVPGLLQTLAIMAFQFSLSSVLLMSSLLGYSFVVMKLLRLSVYFVSLCFWYHSIFAFLFHLLSLYAPKIVVVFFWWFWAGIFCIRPFPLLLGLTSFQYMILTLFLVR